MKKLIVSIFVMLSLIMCPIASTGESDTLAYRPKKVYRHKHKKVYRHKHKNVYKGKRNPSWKYHKPVPRHVPPPVYRKRPVYRTPPRTVYRTRTVYRRPAHHHRGCFIDSSMFGND